MPAASPPTPLTIVGHTVEMRHNSDTRISGRGFITDVQHCFSSLQNLFSALGERTGRDATISSVICPKPISFPHERPASQFTSLEGSGGPRPQLSARRWCARNGTHTFLVAPCKGQGRNSKNAEFFRCPKIAGEMRERGARAELV